MPRISKKFALLLVLAMMATMFVGMGTASAATTNSALTIPTVSVDANNGQTLGTIQLVESTIGSIGSNTIGGTVYEQVVVTLPAGSQFVTPAVVGTFAQFVDCPTNNTSGTLNGIEDGNLQFVAGTNRTLVFNITGRSAANGSNPAVINLLFNGASSQVKISSGAADYAVNILDTTNAISSGDVINAHVGVGGTSAYALSAPTVSQGTGKALGIIRIVENTKGALDNTASHNSISVTVPEGITITEATCTTAGGFPANSITNGAGTANTAVLGTTSSGLSKATFYVINKSQALPGIIDITLTVTVDLNAKKGDIVATIGGNNTYITPTTVIVGKYGEYGITAACDDPTNIYAGRVDAKIGTFVITENVVATLVADRSVNLELPEGCKWVTIPTPVTTKSSLQLTNGQVLTGSSERIASFKVNPASSGSASTVEFRQGTVSVPADFPAGDLNITFSGTAGAEADDGSKVTVKVATIVTPITLTGATPSPTIIIGAQDQTDTSFEVVEAGVGALAAKGPAAGTTVTAWRLVSGNIFEPVYAAASTYNAELWIQAPAGVYFTDLPEISVTGDLKIDTNGVKLSSDDKNIILPITTSSTSTASTISFKNVHFTVDRTVPQGAMKLTATGTAVDQWFRYYEESSLTAAAKGQVAQVTTPAPDAQNKVATFVVGQSTFTLEGVEITMDVAPYIKDSRTFLPIAYVGQALGIDANNINWDGVNQTVTLMKGDKVLQLKIGSTTMLVNGVALTLDAAPEINNSRTCLPIALVAKAFGESASWDAATQTVTIQ
jgi:Copper amine oxidase N-terminal domain.